MKTIDFQHNWNQKLDCNAFTTFRLHSGKYRVGDLYSITVKGKHVKTVRCESVKTLTLSQVNDWVALIDTGYDLPNFTKLVKTMYKNIVTRWDTQQFDLVLLYTVQ